MQIKTDKYKLYAVASFVAFFAFIFFADSQAGSDDLYKNAKFRQVRNKAFGFGEKLVYDVQYGFIKAGEGTMQIMKKPLNIKGRQAYDLRFSVKSAASLDLFYHVRDRYRSAIDVKGIFPWIFEQKIREGGYRHYFKAFFDQLGHKAYANKKKYKVPEYVNDVLSAFYYVRTLDLASMKPGHLIHLKNFWKDSTYTLSVRIHKRKIVEVPSGKFRCIVVEPVDMQGGLFRNIGNIYIYLTDDEVKMPVKVATKILIGEVSAQLTHYSGIKGTLKAKLK